MTPDPAQLLRDARRRHGLNQERVAHLAATSQAQISRIERGKISPSLDTLARLLAVMGERLELSAAPVRGNDDDHTLRADYEHLTAIERLAQAATLSRTLTSLAASGRRS